MLAIGSIKGQVKEKGSADVVVVPARVVGRMLLGAINPLNWLKVLLGALAALTVGALAAAVIAGAQWLVAHGTDGILAAMRMGAWAHALTYAAFAACVLAAARWRAHRRPARERAAPCVAPYPRSRGGRAHRVHRDRVRVDRGRGPERRRELPARARRARMGPRRAARRCRRPARRDRHQRARRRDRVPQRRPGEALDRARTPPRTPSTIPMSHASPPTRRVRPTRARSRPRRSSAHNHLASWVEIIEIAVGDQVVLTIDRSGLSRDEPLTDAAVLRAARGRDARLVDRGRAAGERRHRAELLRPHAPLASRPR